MSYLQTLVSEPDYNEIQAELSYNAVRFANPESENNFWELCMWVLKPSYISIDIPDLIGTVRDSVAKALHFGLDTQTHLFTNLAIRALENNEVGNAKRLFLWFVMPEEIKESQTLLKEIEELNTLLVPLASTKEIIWGLSIGGQKTQCGLIVLFPVG